MKSCIKYSVALTSLAFSSALLIGEDREAPGTQPPGGTKLSQSERRAEAAECYKLLTAKAERSTEVLKLLKLIDDQKFFRDAAWDRARPPRRTSGGGGGLFGIASRMGDEAGRMQAAKTAQQYERALIKNRGKYNGTLQTAIWKAASADQQQLLIEFYPDVVREAGAAHRLPRGPEDQRPPTWVKLQPEGEGFRAWLPKQPTVEESNIGRSGSAVQYDVDAGKISYDIRLMKLNLPPAAFVGEGAKLFLKTCVDGLSKSVGGSVTSNEPFSKNESDGRRVVIGYQQNGVAMQLISRVVVRDGALLTLSCRAPESMRSARELNWFFDSIELL